MAEVTPDISPIDYFNLAAGFEVSSSEEQEEKQTSEALTANGDLFCFAEYDEMTNYTEEATYCGGATPDIVTALGTLLSTFGDVPDVCVNTQIAVTFSAGKQATLSLEGHQHDTNPHVVSTLITFDASGIIPASSGLGVPELIVVAGDVSPMEATVTITMEHIDKIGADGDHFAAQNRTCKCEISVSYEGTVTGTTPGNWIDIRVTNSKENTDTPTSTVTATQYIDQ